MNDGGYVGADARGCNFCSILRVLEGHSYPFLTALLSGSIPPQAIEDKVVLIGVMAESVKDFFYTPYSRGPQADHQTSGSSCMPISLVNCSGSRLIATRLLQPRRDWHEGIWILLWSVLGGAVGVRVRSPGAFLWLTTAACCSSARRLSRLCEGVVGALVPPAIAWLSSAALITAYMVNQESSSGPS